MREQCGNAALYFDLLNVDELSSCMIKILEDGDLSSRLVEEPAVRANMLSVDELSNNLDTMIGSLR